MYVVLKKKSCRLCRDTLSKSKYQKAFFKNSKDIYVTFLYTFFFIITVESNLQKFILLWHFYCYKFTIIYTFFNIVITKTQSSVLYTFLCLQKLVLYFLVNT